MITIFILDGVINNYIVIDLILFYLYFYHNKNSFFIGLLYDIIYTDTLFLHAFLFTFVSFGISKTRKKNIYYFILILMIYHIIEYLILLLMKVHIFTYQDIYLLIKTILINSFIVYIINYIHKKIRQA